MALSVKINVQSSTPNNLSTTLSTAASTVQDANSTLNSARLTLTSGNEGATADAIAGSLSDKRRELEDLSADISSLSDALSTFSSSMESVNQRLNGASSSARESGLTVSGDSIEPPKPDDPEYDKKALAYSNLDADIAIIRADETEAHSTLSSACSAITHGKVAQLAAALGFPGGAGNLGGMISLTALGISAMQWQDIKDYGRFQITHGKLAGKHAARNVLQTLHAKTDPRNWVSRARHVKPNTNWWSRGGVTALKVVNRASGVAVGLTAGWEQYQKDSHNPSMGEGERYARAGTQAALQGSLGYTGAWAGAQVGATIGALGGPVGIAVGGAVGGIVGGLAGSKLGEQGANLINKGISALFH